MARGLNLFYFYFTACNKLSSLNKSQDDLHFPRGSGFSGHILDEFMTHDQTSVGARSGIPV